MAEEFVSPVGILSDTSENTWSLVVGSDGNLELRSNSPAGAGEPRMILDDDTGEISIGAPTDPARLTVTDTVAVQGADGLVRLRLDAPAQTLEVIDIDGNVIGAFGGAGNLRAGSNGENGQVYLYRSDAPDISQNGAATIRLDGRRGDATLGDNGTNGDIFLRDTNGITRARLRAGGQRLEVLSPDGEIIGMLGGAGNIRAGSNGESGDLMLFPPDATDIFSNSDATARISASSGDLRLGGNGVNGDALLNDVEGTVRARVSASGQRIELSNRQGQIIGMLGGAGNIRAGTSGENGELYLFRAQSSNIFANGDATMSMNASNGNAVFGGNGVTGDLFLRDGNDNTRVRLSSSGQRLELLNGGGEIIGMIGGAGNIRAGTNGESGNLYLFPSEADDIFSNGQATIRMDGQSGDIILQNADFAEDFDIAAAEFADAEAGCVMVLQEDGTLARCGMAYDRRLVGVISGAGKYRPGIVMDSRDDDSDRLPIALVGKVYCNVDAQHGAIATGDLLTTSVTTGCAMKARDRDRAFGAVLGKALAPHDAGIGQIPVLVNLQ